MFDAPGLHPGPNAGFRHSRELEFYRLEEGGEATPVGLSRKGQACPIDDLAYGPRIAPWAVPEYLSELETLAEAFGLELQVCARKYGVIELPEPEGGQRWRYQWALGFSRLKLA